VELDFICIRDLESISGENIMGQLMIMDSHSWLGSHVEYLSVSVSGSVKLGCYVEIVCIPAFF